MDEGLDPADEALARDLAERGPRLLRQEALEREEPREEFVRTLRRRLAGEMEPVVRRQPRRIWRWRFVWSGAGLIAVAAVLALLLLRPGRRTESPPPQAFSVPLPARPDILRGYPPVFGQGGGGFPSSACSLSQDETGPRAYPGRIQLQAQRFSAPPRELPAYRLTGPSFDLSRIQTIARALGIRGTLRRVRIAGEPWLCVAQSGPGPAPSYTRLLISERTGELDFKRSAPGTGTDSAPVNSPANVRAAQVWLRRAGWPRLPLHTPTSSAESAMQGSVLLGWNGVGESDVPAASFLVDARGRIYSAHLWPPIGTRTTIETRPYAAAFDDVQRGRDPLALARPVPSIMNGHGTVTSAKVQQVLALSAGNAYLVPAYRFDGVARLGGASYPWFALAPAGR